MYGGIYTIGPEESVLISGVSLFQGLTLLIEDHRHTDTQKGINHGICTLASKW